MKSFSNETLNFFYRNFWTSNVESCQDCVSSRNLVAETPEKLWSGKARSAGEPCTCEYVTLLCYI